MTRTTFAALLLCAATAAEPLFLTEMIQRGDIARAQAMAAVNLPGLPDLKSYSGYVTVNASSNGQTFFWYFPPLNGNTSAPTLMWLQGGPGASSLFALFTENGPITVDANGTHAIPNYELTWAREYGMVYVDNPLGVGFSLTNPSGYATQRGDYMTTLYRFVQQFFTLFPALQQNDFYVTGESYAGKYVPSAAYRIHQENQAGSQPYIPLKGIIVGDGLCDPLTMVQQYAQLTETFSLVDWNQVKVMQAYSDQAVNDIYAQNWLGAFQQFDLMINGDLSGVSPYLANVTGFSDYFNALSPFYPQSTVSPNPFEVYLNRPEIQAALHVNTTYSSYTQAVEVAIVNDVCQSVKDLFPTLLENYDVLLYSGQFDVIVGAPLTIAFIRSIDWSGNGAFEIAQREIWHSRSPAVGVMGQLHGSTDVAGWHTQSGNFHYVIVRNAGHMVPTDQPVWALDMITRFIRGIPFTAPVPNDIPNPTGSNIVADLRKLAELHANDHITADEYAKAKSKLLA